MHFNKTKIEGCFSINPEQITDERGSFFRVFCDEEFKKIVGAVHFKQINHSINNKQGTFRGMHYQTHPYTEAKLIRCVSGSVIDYFLDLRKGSPTFLKYGTIELSSNNKTMLYLCAGIAHGFFTLEDNTELIYHHTQSYQKEADRGIRFDDPLICIKLPSDINVISKKDQEYKLLTADFRGLEI